MTQKFTILFDLDGTLVDTAPDLMNAHNHVMRKFGYETKSTDDIRKLVGQGAGSLIGRSVWGQAKKELKKIILRSIHDISHNKKLIKNAKKTFYKFHNSKDVKLDFQKVLCDSVKNKNAFNKKV